MTFNLKVPEGLPPVADDYTRKYVALDIHCTPAQFGENEECHVIELPATLSADGAEYSISTSKFSGFVFTYFDELAPEPTPVPEPTPTPEDDPIDVPNTGIYTAYQNDNNSVNGRVNMNYLSQILLPATIIASVIALAGSLLRHLL